MSSAARQASTSAGCGNCWMRSTLPVDQARARSINRGNPRLDRHQRGIDAGILGGGRHRLQGVEEIAHARDLDLLDRHVLLLRQGAHGGSQIESSGQPEPMEGVLLEKGRGDDGSIALPFTGIGGEAGALG